MDEFLWAQRWYGSRERGFVTLLVSCFLLGPKLESGIANSLADGTAEGFEYYSATEEASRGVCVSLCFSLGSRIDESS